jgi:hypothetical protein
MCEINHFKVYVLCSVMMWQLMWTTYMSKRIELVSFSYIVIDDEKKYYINFKIFIIS